MKANHNYYVNSAESLADAIKAIFFPPPRRKTYGPVALAAPHLNRAKNQLVLLQPKQNRWHCSHLLSAHRVCALMGDHCHHGQRHLVLPPDLPPEWFKNPQPGGWASCWLSLAGAGCQGSEVAPTPASLHSCATPVPPDHQHPTDRCCCSHATMKGRPQKQSIFLLQSSVGIIIKKKKTATPHILEQRQTLPSPRYPHVPGKGIIFHQAFDCYGSFDHTNAQSSHGNGPRKRRVRAQGCFSPSPLSRKSSPYHR